MTHLFYGLSGKEVIKFDGKKLQNYDILGDGNSGSESVHYELWIRNMLSGTLDTCPECGVTQSVFSVKLQMQE